jgi:hypothetical protein
VAAASREALSARQPGSSTVARRCGPEGQDENTEVSMSTTTISRKMEKETAIPPEWRRICYRYEGESQVSMCGAARRKPCEDHWDDECSARGHGMCVVCEELLEKEQTTR